MTAPDLNGRTILAMRALWEQRPLIERARDCGARVIAVDEEADADGFEAAHEAEVVPSIRDPTAVYEVATEHDVDAVVTDQCDYSLFTIAYVGTRLGLEGVDLETAGLTTNKRFVREKVGNAAPQPDYEACRTRGDVQAAAQRIGFPCIVKPVDNRGGFGVSRVGEHADLETAYFEALGNSHSREILVESFIEGVPVTVDGYCIDGDHRSLAVASKNSSLGSLNPNLEIQYPADLTRDDIEAAKRVNDSVAEAIGVAGGATHAEYVYADGQFHLLEFQNRGGGVYTSAKIVPAVTGFDVTDQLLADAVGQTTGQGDKGYEMDRAAIMRFLDFEPGYVQAIRNHDRVRDREEVLALQLYFEVGDELEDFRAFTDSHGVIIGTGETVAEAESAIDDALDELTVVYS